MCWKTTAPTELVAAHSSFTSGFLKETFQADGNLLTSPFSVFVLLSALFGAEGPKGNTGTEICKVLFGPAVTCSDTAPAAARALAIKYHNSLTSAMTEIKDESVQVVKLANAAFIQQDFSIKPTFRDYFIQAGSTFEEVDFIKMQAVGRVNEWIHQKTDGLIPKFYSEPTDISADTRLLLLNTLLVKDEWQKTFSAVRTKKQQFHVDASTQMEIDMMSSLESLYYGLNEDKGYHFIGKPLKNNRFQFVVILPTDRHALDQVADVLTSTFDWESLQNSTTKKTIKLTLPRFQIKHELDVKAVLTGMGIRDLFMTAANLQGITDQAALFVKKVTQKSVLKVNEHGVEAAAVTSMQISLTSIIFPEMDFNVDEPFFCSIYDTQLKLPLFVARVDRPEVLEA